MKHFVKRATASLLVLILSIGGIYTAIWAYESTEEDTELVHELPENFVYEDTYIVYEESYYDDFVDGIHIDLGHLDSDDVEAIIIDLGELGSF